MICKREWKRKLKIQKVCIYLSVISQQTTTSLLWVGYVRKCHNIVGYVEGIRTNDVLCLIAALLPDCATHYPHTSETIRSFKSHHKTHLFRLANSLYFIIYLSTTFMFLNTFFLFNTIQRSLCRKYDKKRHGIVVITY